MTKTYRVFGLTGALALAACGSSSSPPSTAEAYCQAVLAAEVSRLSRCVAYDVPVSTLEAVFDCQTVGEAEAAGRISYDPSAIAPCLDGLRSLSCNLLWDDGEGAFQTLYTTCMAPLTPRVAEGDPCYSQLGYECASHYCPYASPDACWSGSTCGAPAGLGESCLEVACAPDLACQAGTCVARPAIQVVGRDEPCTAAGVYCADSLYCAAGACVDRKPADAGCSDSVECDAGLYCELTCTAFLHQGDDCTTGRCGSGLWCNADERCAPYPRLGDACSTPRALTAGPRLERSAPCWEGWCDTGEPDPTCKPFLAPGGPCSLAPERAFFECGPGYACYETTVSTSTGYCGRSYCPGID
jgi:hypothetical protein